MHRNGAFFMLKITERAGNRGERRHFDMSEFKTIETQEDLDRIVKERLARQKEKYADYDELKSRVKELEDENAELHTAADVSAKDKTAQENQIAELQSKISDYETEKTRTRVALQYGLPLDLASRLRGDDEEALKQDAENLAGLMHANEPKAPLK